MCGRFGFLSSFIFICLIARVSAAVPYNEALDANMKFRLPYRVFMNQHPGIKPLSPSSELVQALVHGHPLGDKLKILPIPLILDQSEYENVIKSGVNQRARALVALFDDVILGNARVSEMPNGPSIDLLKAIMTDENESYDYLRFLWSGKSKASIHFVYGADLIRNPDGNWVLLEDNVGPVGGSGDLSSTHEAYFKTLGVERKESNEFKDMIRFFLEANGVTDVEKQVLAVMHEPALKLDEDEDEDSPKDPYQYDLEDERRRQIIKELGIPIISNKEMKIEKINQLKASEVKVLLNLSEPSGWVQQSEAMRILFKEKGVEYLESPGTQWLSSKALLPFMEDLVRFYLSEEPIIHTQPTKIMDRKIPLSEILSEKNFFPTEAASFVIKKANGTQGREVKILNRFSKEALKADNHYQRTLEAWANLSGNRANLYVIQEYVDASILPSGFSKNSWANFMVDVRPITVVAGDSVHTVKQPWGRSISSLGDGLNNVSRGAFELVVLTQDCSSALTKLK